MKENENKQINEPISTYTYNNVDAIKDQLLLMGAKKSDLEDEGYHTLVMSREVLDELMNENENYHHASVEQLMTALKNTRLISLMGLSYYSERCILTVMEKENMQAVWMEIHDEKTDAVEEDLRHFVQKDIHYVFIRGQITKRVLKMMKELILEEDLCLILLNHLGGLVIETNDESDDTDMKNFLEEKVCASLDLSAEEAKMTLMSLIDHEMVMLINDLDEDEEIKAEMKDQLNKELPDNLDVFVSCGLLVLIHHRYIMTIHRLHDYYLNQAIEKCRKQASSKTVKQLKEKANNLLYQYQLLLHFRYYVTDDYTLYKFKQNFVLGLDHCVYIFSSLYSVDTDLFKYLINNKDHEKAVVIYRGNTGTIKDIQFMNDEEFKQKTRNS